MSCSVSSTGLKKSLDLPIDSRRILIDAADDALSVSEQCELLGLARSSYYYEPTPETEENLKVMNLMDEVHIEHPYYGSRQLSRVLGRRGHSVNRKRVVRLMRILNIEAMYPRPRTSVKQPGHEIYPYLLKGLEVSYPNQVWCTDITYIRMARGFLYLVAVMDWYSRYVLSWSLSNTLDSDFCVSAVAEGLENHNHPEIFNTDQGSQFTSIAFTEQLKSHGIRISMDGRGRYLDNIFIERLWRTVKYEEVYLKGYSNGLEARSSLEKYFLHYNANRPHSSLDGKTPREMYYGLEKVIHRC